MALIRDEDIDEVRDRVEIVDIISSHVQLKKAGRLFKGLCPFHNEKTPSFTVDPEKQLYHCFGCGEGGNVYTFIMKMERMDFPEAVQYLAEKAGYTLRTEEKLKDKRADQSKLTRLYSLNKRAMDYFTNTLSTKQGDAARDYLQGRGYTEEAVERFMIGLSPTGWDDLTRKAIGQGASQQDLIDAGLSVRSEKDSKKMYDRFRGRLMFPIFDIHERVIGFGGRVLTDETPKYLNTSETPVFHKGKTLYALNWAKKAITDTGEAVIVEGYTDVISLHDAGVGNAVATLGTALTADHLRLLARFAKRIVLVFDADMAGEKAVERGIDLAADFYLGAEYRPLLEILDKRHLDLFVASLPAGNDPADYVTAHGKDEFIKLVEQAEPFVDFSLKAVINKQQIKNISDKQAAAARAMDVIAMLPGNVTREYYLKVIAEMLDISYRALFADFARIQKNRTGYRKASSPRTETAVQMNPEERLELEVLRACIKFPETLRPSLAELDTKHFTTEMNQRLFLLLSRALETSRSLDVAALIDHAEDERLKTMLTSMATEAFNVDDLDAYSKELLKRMKEFELKRRIHTLKDELTEINPQQDPTRYDELFERLLALEVERREL
jgi:DNA primase